MMPDDFSEILVLRVADLSQHHPTRFCLKPDKPARDRLAQALAITGIRKLLFEGDIAADSKTDWQLTGKLGATVVQPCVVTLDPVTTRIDLPVTRHFIAGLVVLAGQQHEDTEEGVEMPHDDTQEPLGPEIDLGRIMAEVLALALPDYPRVKDAALEQSTFAAPNVVPMTDMQTKPFAGLASLKDKLEKPN